MSAGVGYENMCKLPLSGNLQFEERLIIVTIDGFLLKMGWTLLLKY